MSSELNVSRTVLESAAQRDWDEPSEYSSIYLLPTRKKHDSGWHSICIVGKTEDGFEKAAFCDDICWLFQPVIPGQFFSMRTDMTFPGGVVHCWGWNTRFRVGESLSSTDVYVFGVPK